MSIIERALGKLGTTAKPAEPAAPPQETPSASASGLAERAATQPVAEPATASPTSKPAATSPTRDAGAPRSVTIDLARMERLGMLTPQTSRNQLAEEMRHIKRPLLANAFGPEAQADKHRNLIMVTSAFPGEGKTFCAINLAISMATEMDRTVLLIDADVARPRLLEYLGLRAPSGLLDVLRDPSLDMGGVLLRTNINTLTILPAGANNRHSTELLASEAMTELIDEMASRYPDRIIIFDSPPLLVTSEAAVLARHMGQVVMVVEADKTPKAGIKEAVSLIEDSCDIIGMVLNKTNVSQGTAGFYGYGYGYGDPGN